MKIAFIGTGVMGNSIIKHLLNAGHEVTIFTRTKSKALNLISLGAIWVDKVEEAVKNQELVFTMVGMPQDVREIYFGETGIIQNADEHTILIDMTTSNPSLAEEIFDAAKVNNLYSIDAPVSGGDVGAKNGTLSLMIGGEKHILEKVSPVLETFSSTIVYQGEAGSGQHAKMCNQILVANNLIGVCESLAYAVKTGLKVEDVLKSVATGAAGSWALSNLGPRIIHSDFEPGFYVKHMLKDLKIALTEAEKVELNLPGLRLAHDMFQQLEIEGFGEKGTQVLMKYYAKHNKF